MSVTLNRRSSTLPFTPSRFSIFPLDRSSRTTTSWPRRASSSTVFEPINPAPPVTRYRIGKSSFFVNGLDGQGTHCRTPTIGNRYLGKLEEGVRLSYPAKSVLRKR